MKRGLTRFSRSETLTSYPVDELKTPGISATPLFNLYTPIADTYQSGKLDVQKDIIDEPKLQIKEELSGAGAVPVEPVASGSGHKRKIDNDVFEKMLHPTFKVSKVIPKKELKKQKKEEQAGEGSSKRKIFKF